MRALLKVITVLVVLGAVTVGVLRYMSTTGEDPSLGLRDGLLAECPETPTCVSSQAPAEDEIHYIEPLPLGDPDTIGERLRLAVEGLADVPAGEDFGSERWMREIQKRATVEVLTANENFVYATVEMPLVGLIDDLELQVDRDAGVVHLRSASRVGNSDMGVNRLRISMLREALEQQ